MKKGKIAFVQWGSFSHINDRLLQALANEFSDYQFDAIDVLEHVNHKTLKNITVALKEHGLEILSGHLSGRRRMLRYLVRTSYFFKSVKEKAEEVLSKGDYTFTFQTQSLFDASITGIPHFVYTDHTHLADLRYPGVTKESHYAQAWVELERNIYRNASMIFTTSDFSARSIIEDYHCPESKVACVYTGINVSSDFKPGQKDYGKKNLLFVGIDWERKGGADLIAAFEQVLKIHPDAQLTIVGCKPQLDLPNCRIIGRIPADQVKQYYEEATIFCLPSKMEPSSVALAEAAAHGLPVVSTRVGGTPDRVLDGKTGYLVSPGNVDQIADALLDLLAEEEKRKSFGEQGYYLMLERFSWSRVSAKIKEGILPFIDRPEVLRS